MIVPSQTSFGFNYEVGKSLPTNQTLALTSSGETLLITQPPLPSTAAKSSLGGESEWQYARAGCVSASVSDAPPGIPDGAVTVTAAGAANCPLHPGDAGREQHAAVECQPGIHRFDHARRYQPGLSGHHPDLNGSEHCDCVQRDFGGKRRQFAAGATHQRLNTAQSLDRIPNVLARGGDLIPAPSP